MDQNTIDKLRKLYNESTNELAKQSAKKKLQDAGVSLTESAKSEGSKMDQNTIDKLRKLYNESTNDLAKQSAKKKLMDAGVSLSESEGKSEPKAKAKKPKTEPKPKSEPKAKAESKSTAKDDYDCDDLIKKEKERKAKAKANSIKRANAPKKTPTTKNKEAVQKTATKVEKSVQTRAKKGQVKVAELEKLISEYEQAIKRLRALLSKVKSGKKFAEGGNMGMMDSEQSNEYNKIKDHHCGCSDKMAKGGNVGEWMGVDADLETSLEEYDFVAQPYAKNGKKDEYFVIYKMGDDAYGSGYIRESELDAIVMGKEWADKDDIEGMLSFNGDSKEEFIEGSFTNKMSNLIGYYGIENIMGTDYYLKDKDWAYSKIGIEPTFARGGEIKSSIDVDRHYRALPKGKRTSEKVAYIDIRGGGTFTRRNANQYGKTKGGNTYYEYNDNRSDKRKNGWLEKGGEINYKKNWEVIYVTNQGKKVTKNITLGRMSTESDVKNSLKEKGLNIQKVVSIKLIGK